MHLSYNRITSAKLIWDNWNKEHIKKHNVSIPEIEEVFYSKHKKEQSYLGRIIIFGRTKQNRLLTIVVSYALQKEPYVVSARNMSKKERKKYES